MLQIPNLLSRSMLTLLAVLVIVMQAGRMHGQALTYGGNGTSSHGAQEEITYKLSGSKEVMMNLSGTTPIKNWAMSAHGLSGEAKMAVAANNRLMDIHALSFSLPVHNLKGDRAAMDSDAYKALKADRYPAIGFQLISANIEPRNANNYSVQAHGNLTVAGVTREVVLKMTGVVANDGSLTFTGAEQVKMSDYNVERPSLLFGLIKADDMMTLTYTLVFIR
jgi:hypothetical protein